mmetsp:Transcript_14438/g.35330  ORF Transcript_14438/g.35330 Transcript_14438/m.35330 type:complete len:227 (+) Transcript_14438:1230-1910(+)
MAIARGPVQGGAPQFVLQVHTGTMLNELLGHLNVRPHHRCVQRVRDDVARHHLHVLARVLQVRPRAHPGLLAAVVAHVLGGGRRANLAVGHDYRPTHVQHRQRPVLGVEPLDCLGFSLEGSLHELVELAHGMDLQLLLADPAEGHPEPALVAAAAHAGPLVPLPSEEGQHVRLAILLFELELDLDPLQPEPLLLIVEVRPDRLGGGVDVHPGRSAQPLPRGQRRLR